MNDRESIQLPPLAEVVESLSDAVSFIDREWRIRFVNSAAVEMSGRPAEALIGHVIWDLYPDTDDTPFGPAYRRAMETGEFQTVEAYYAPLDATFEARVFPHAGGLTVVTRDVSVDRRSQRALASAEERQRLILRATQDAIWDWDLTTDEVRWNEGFVHAFGHERAPSDGAARWSTQMIHPEDRDRVNASLQEVLASPGADAWSAEYRLVQGDGSLSWVNDRGFVVRGPSGQPLRVVGALQDVTLERTVQAAIDLRARQDALLADVGLAYTRSASSTALLEACTAAIVEHLEVAFARAWLVDESREHLILRASAGMYTHLDGDHAVVPVGQMKIGRIAANRAPHLTNEVLSDPEISDPEWAQREGMVAFAGYPLMFEDRVLGVVALFSRHPLPSSTIDILRHTCEGISVSIERFRMHRRVQRSEQRLRTFVATADIVWLASPEGQLSGDLSSWCAFTGQSEDAVRGEGGFAAVHPDDRDRVAQVWADAMARREPFAAEYRLRRHDGQWRTVVARGLPVFDAEDRVLEWAGTIMDRTELREAESALAESETRFEKMADSAPVILWVTDATGVCTYLNQSWYEFTGEPAGPVPADPWADRVHPDDAPRLRSARHTFAHRHEPYRAEYRLRDHGGEYRWVLDSATPRAGSDGVFRGYIGSILDISKRKLIERERERLLHREADARREAEDANRLKDEFLAAVSHELRTPLNAVLGWAQMLRRGVLSDAQRAKAVDTIERNARLQSQLIEDLLDVSRIVSGKLRLERAPLDVAEVVQQAVDSVAPMAESEGVTLAVELAGPGALVGDAARLQQVVWNLLSNAVKFTPAGGTVCVTAGRREGQIEIEVTDTGVGIAPEFLPRVFDRFRQAGGGERRRGGLGLGLAIVRSLVELHGGAVAAESEGVGRGSTFRVTLPGRGGLPDAPSKAPEPNDDLPTLNDVTVLIVDDEPDARDVLQAMLESRGATVLVEARGADALTRLEVARPDILLSDIGMPEMDGYTLIAHVRTLPAERGGKTPAVALTAYARPQDRARALLAGFQSHVPKPVEPAELLAVIASLLGTFG